MLIYKNRRKITAFYRNMQEKNVFSFKNVLFVQPTWHFDHLNEHGNRLT